MEDNEEIVINKELCVKHGINVRCLGRKFLNQGAFDYWLGKYLTKKDLQDKRLHEGIQEKRNRISKRLNTFKTVTLFEGEETDFFDLFHFHRNKKPFALIRWQTYEDFVIFCQYIIDNSLYTNGESDDGFESAEEEPQTPVYKSKNYLPESSESE